MERTDEPVASGVGRGAIGGEELCLTKAGRDGCIFDASVLVYWEFICRQSMLKTGECGLESRMTDDGLVCGRDVNAHEETGWRGRDK